MELDIKLMRIMLTQRFGRKNIFLQRHHPVPLAKYQPLWFAIYLCQF